ncbi:MAG: alpha/beta hydrolase [Acidobacteriota bacterium]
MAPATSTSPPASVALGSRREEMVPVEPDVRLHVVIEGSGPPVVLLHGFPELWYSWRHQMPALASAGFTAIAPDLRGYNTSDKPRGVARYKAERLAEDVAALCRALGHERAVIVGHDWGGAVAWTLAMTHPTLVERLVVMNCPHPAIMARRVLRPAQLRRSWYMFFFQIPFLPERWVCSRDFIRRALRGTSANPAAFGDDDLARFYEAIAVPGAARAAIDYYRAAFRRLPLRPTTIACPVLLVWGDRDRFLGQELIQGTERLAPMLRVHHVPDASHWVQQDRPEEVNRVLLAFLREGTGQS